MTRLSVVIPAFNEAKYIGACIAHVRAALEANAGRLAWTEIIVTDNNSSDDTAGVAQECGAQVVFEPHNQISRARNAGAAVARGDWLLFVDADSLVYPQTIAEMLDRIERGRYVGGGCAVRLDRAPWYGHLLAWAIVGTFRILRYAGGSFVFCRAEAFRDVGGFSEEVYAGEEVFLTQALKRWGRARKLRFTFLTRRPLITSGRKFDHYTTGHYIGLMIRGALAPRRILRSRKELGFFYDGQR